MYSVKFTRGKHCGLSQLFNGCKAARTVIFVDYWLHWWHISISGDRHLPRKCSRSIGDVIAGTDVWAMLEDMSRQRTVALSSHQPKAP